MLVAPFRKKLWKKWKRGEYPCHEGCRSIRIPLGNTAAIAREIAEGIGPGARALSTAEASGTTIADADLIVAGAPVIQFHLPSVKTREKLGVGWGKALAAPHRVLFADWSARGFGERSSRRR